MTTGAEDEDADPGPHPRARGEGGNDFDLVALWETPRDEDRSVAERIIMILGRLWITFWVVVCVLFMVGMTILVVTGQAP